MDSLLSVVALGHRVSTRTERIAVAMANGGHESISARSVEVAAPRLPHRRCRWAASFKTRSVNSAVNPDYGPSGGREVEISGRSVEVAAPRSLHRSCRRGGFVPQ
jgi:hypothetical protein